MKKVFILFTAVSLFALASCDTEHCTCHTFGAVQKKGAPHTTTASTEKPNSNAQ